MKSPRVTSPSLFGGSISPSRILGYSLPLLLSAASLSSAAGKPADAPVSKPGGPKVMAAASKGGKAAPVAAPAPAATTAQSFEELLKEAVPAKDLATLLEPLYARCDDKEGLQKRQCEGEKTYLLDYLRGHTFVAEADVQPDTTPYDATAKQVDLEVPGCLACSEPITIGGESRFVVLRPPSRVVNGKAVTQPIATHEIALEDRVKADRFVERVAPRLRVQHVFRVGSVFGETPAAAPPQPAPATAPAKGPAPVAAPGPVLKGILVSGLGHRVYDRCTGDVHAATPASTARVAVRPDPRDPACPKKGSADLSAAELKKAAEHAALPERLTPRQIDSVLAPVQSRIHECYMEFGEPSGVAKVAVTIGGEGRLTTIALPPPFDKADIGVCIRSQLKQTTFPRFRGQPMSIDYVYQVQ
jgi:hypothetical protein